MRFPLLAVCALGAAQTLGAQVSGQTLTMDEAITIAQRNNPAHLQVVNNRRSAGAALRASYAALLPNVSASLGSSYRQGGQQIFQGQSIGAVSATRQSQYDFGVDYSLNAAKILAPRVESANAQAVEADIIGSAQLLRATVAQQYLSTLQADARATLQDTLVLSAQAQLDLAKARQAVGSATIIDVRRAEVAVGQAQVTALQAHNTAEIEKLRLFQYMGVPQPPDVTLTSCFVVTEVGFSLDSVLSLAQRMNPTLDALRSREHVATLSVRQARSAYTPTFSLSTGFAGYTSVQTDPSLTIAQGQASAIRNRESCFSQDSVRRAVGLPSIGAGCSAIGFTDADAARIRSANSTYPFSFTRSPWSLQAQLSLPLFNGLAREQRVEEAAAAREDARFGVRAQQLRLTADVTAAYLTLNAASRTASLQEQNSAKAREELELVQERYKVGAATYVEITDARASYERAESDRINAIYDYHKAFAALESAVGHSLR